MRPPAAIDWGLIGQVIGVSFLASTVAVLLFATVILGSVRAADARRAGRGGTATGFSLLAAAALAAFLAIVLLAIVVMLRKG